MSGLCRMYCARPRDRYHALLRNRDVINWGLPLGASNIKSTSIELKFGTGMFSTTPETTAMTFCLKMTSLTGHAHFAHLLRERSKCSDRAEHWHDCSLKTSRRPFTHMLHEKSMWSDLAEVDTNVTKAWPASTATMILGDSNVLPVYNSRVGLLYQL